MTSREAGRSQLTLRHPVFQHSLAHLYLCSTELLGESPHQIASQRSPGLKLDDTLQGSPVNGKVDRKS